MSFRVVCLFVCFLRYYLKLKKKFFFATPLDSTPLKDLYWLSQSPHTGKLLLVELGEEGEAGGKAEGEEKSFSFAGQNPECSENLCSPRGRYGGWRGRGQHTKSIFSYLFYLISLVVHKLRKSQWIPSRTKTVLRAQRRTYSNFCFLSDSLRGAGSVFKWSWILLTSECGVSFSKGKWIIVLIRSLCFRPGTE